MTIAVESQHSCHVGQIEVSETCRQTQGLASSGLWGSRAAGARFRRHFRAVGSVACETRPAASHCCLSCPPGHHRAHDTVPAGANLQSSQEQQEFLKGPLRHPWTLAVPWAQPNSGGCNHFPPAVLPHPVLPRLVKHCMRKVQRGQQGCSRKPLE